MKGLTRLIIKDLENGIPVGEISLKYNVTSSAIYKTAQRHNIEIMRNKLSDEEKRIRKKESDSRYYQKKSALKRELDYTYERPDIPMPELPRVAAKVTGVGACNFSWVVNQGSKRSSNEQNRKTQQRFGLKTPR